MAAQGIGAMISMPIAARLTDKTGPGRIVLVGLSLTALGLIGLTQVQSDTPMWAIEGMLLLLGLGMGATMMPAMTAALSSLQRHEIARVTSGMNVVQRVGGSVGTALLAVVLSHHIASVMPSAGVQETGLAGARAMTPAMHAAILPALGRAFGDTFVWALGVVVLGLIAATFLPRKRAVHNNEQAAAATLVD
jgi:MFS family permease